MRTKRSLNLACCKNPNSPLFQFRVQRNLTQKTCGQLAGLSCAHGNTTWSAIETSNFRDVSWESLNKIANLLNVSPELICPPDVRTERLKERFSQYYQSRRASAIRTRELQNQEDHLPEAHELLECLTEVLLTLTYREREVLSCLYGLKDGYWYSRTEVSRIFNTTRERIRQIEAKAIRKLQHPARAIKLEGFLDNPVEVQFFPDEWPSLACQPYPLYYMTNLGETNGWRTFAAKQSQT